MEPKDTEPRLLTLDEFLTEVPAINGILDMVERGEYTYDED